MANLPTTKRPQTRATRGWPPARRAAQAARCRAAQPWKRATGPRTAAGKAKSARNAYRHGFRTVALSEIRALLRWQRQYLRARLAGAVPPPVPPLPARLAARRDALAVKHGNSFDSGQFLV